MGFSYVEINDDTNIKVMGIGGAGGNAVNNMIDSGLSGVEFIVANTDNQALKISKADYKIQLGEELAKGRGAGANPQKGRNAALENVEEIRTLLNGNDPDKKATDMVFITAGMGGGTGTGAAPVVAEICKELGILTVAVVSKPFEFEGKGRMKKAEVGIEELRTVTDTLITIPNERLMSLAEEDELMVEMFLKADEVLNHSVKGISDLIMVPGYVNLDFTDVETIMAQSGAALMGIGVASGENRALEAAESAIFHPLLEEVSIKGARGVLLNISSNRNITMKEMKTVTKRIADEVGGENEIIWGQTIDESMGDEIRITVVATGIGQEHAVEDPKVNYLRRATEQTSQTGGRSNRSTAIARGTVRSVTDDDKQKEWQDDVNTVIVAHPKVSNDDGRNHHENANIPAYPDIESDQENLDIPTFLRRSTK
ncbi:cell division protein FtsZ [Desulfocicer vacuolatum DSM 3385]|uniref:Cell division protein FtsZ n=1 Tax=Desulfocicer vacuolatum DSM 3385 TaxID=1121400 RepID=A0A1W1YHJ4_9BACT|nr:cell division protein FtsZ [Desulfocicer vacuolatum]SMC35645.1 cell division protein FtsZ [Desulfocicer vacuolatum DSM 3385]